MENEVPPMGTKRERNGGEIQGHGAASSPNFYPRGEIFISRGRSFGISAACWWFTVLGKSSGCWLVKAHPVMTSLPIPIHSNNRKDSSPSSSPGKSCSPRWEVRAIRTPTGRRKHFYVDHERKATYWNMPKEQTDSDGTCTEEGGATNLTFPSDLPPPPQYDDEESSNNNNDSMLQQLCTN